MSVKTVSVVFKSGNLGTYDRKQYEYITELDVKKGDVAIVDSPNDGYVTVEVKSVLEGIVGKASKYLVQLVDDAGYKEAQVRRAKRADLIKQLEGKKRQVEEMAVWKWLAENDSEAASLLEQLKTI